MWVQSALTLPCLKWAKVQYECNLHSHCTCGNEQKYTLSANLYRTCVRHLIFQIDLSGNHALCFSIHTYVFIHVGTSLWSCLRVVCVLRVVCLERYFDCIWLLPVVSSFGSLMCFIPSPTLCPIHRKSRRKSRRRKSWRPWRRRPNRVTVSLYVFRELCF